MGDVDPGVTAAEIDTTCSGGGCEWKNDSVDLPCPEHFLQRSRTFLFAWRQGSCSFCLLGLVVCIVFAWCIALLHVLTTCIAQFNLKQFCTSQGISEIKGLGGESPNGGIIEMSA